MPTYDYRCEACGHEFEEWQQIIHKKLRKCPKCGKLRLQRLVGAGAGLIFRGTGFYATDYKRKTSASDPKSSGETKSSGDTKSSTEKSSTEKPSTEKPSSGGKG